MSAKTSTFFSLYTTILIITVEEQYRKTQKGKIQFTELSLAKKLKDFDEPTIPL